MLGQELYERTAAVGVTTMPTPVTTINTAAVRAPYATLESRRPSRSPVAVVFIPTDGDRAELLLVIDPVASRCQGEFYSHDFEGDGVGEVSIRQLSELTHVVIGQLDVRGLNLRTEACEVRRIDAAISWSIDPLTGQIDVAGTALVLEPDRAGIVRMEALTGHSFNRFDSLSQVTANGCSPVVADHAPAA